MCFVKLAPKVKCILCSNKFRVFENEKARHTCLKCVRNRKGNADYKELSKLTMAKKRKIPSEKKKIVEAQKRWLAKKK